MTQIKIKARIRKSGVLAEIILENPKKIGEGILNRLARKSFQIGSIMLPKKDFRKIKDKENVEITIVPIREGFCKTCGRTLKNSPYKDKCPACFMFEYNRRTKDYTKIRKRRRSVV